MRASLLLPVLTLLSGSGCLLFSEPSGAPAPSSAAVCGDGLRAGAEACDGADATACNDRTCLRDCTCPLCGDGRPDPDEACDDGNLDDEDACVSSCEAARCGDGVVQRGVESCDEGPATGVGLADCPAGCLVSPTCGDGVRDEQEACDEGGANGTRASLCTRFCTTPRCADGVTSFGEQCDLEPGCSTECELPACSVLSADSIFSGTLYLRSDGEAFGCGTREDDTSGQPPFPVEDLPGAPPPLLGEQLPALAGAIRAYDPDDRAIQVRVGKGYGAALTSRGQVFAFGRNDFGNRGLGHIAPVAEAVTRVPLETVAPEGIRSIAVAGASIAVTRTGRIIGWGGGFGGILGERPTQACARGEPCNPTPGVVDLPGVPAGSIREVAGTGSSAFAVTVSGRAFVWGSDHFGESGVREEQEEPPDHVRLGCEWLLPPDDPDYRPDLRLEALVVWPPRPLVLGDPETRVRTLATGRFFTLALDDEGGLWAFGSNCHGSLVPHLLASPTPRYCADRGVLCHQPEIRTPHPISMTENLDGDQRELAFSAVASSNSWLAAALVDDGRLVAWSGTAEVPIYGPSSPLSSEVRLSDPFALPLGQRGIELAVGSSHLVVRTNLGRLYALGSNAAGSLCTGATDQAPHAEFVEIKPSCERP